MNKAINKKENFLKRATTVISHHQHAHTHMQEHLYKYTHDYRTATQHTST